MVSPLPRSTHGQVPNKPAEGRDEKDYAAPLIDLVSTVLSMQERGSSSAVLSMVETASGLATPFLDKYVLFSLKVDGIVLTDISIRLLTHTLSTHLLTPVQLSSLIVLSKQILFPNGYPGPPPSVPLRAEQALLREGVERRIRELIPG